MEQKQPKIVQRLLVRTFILLLAVAGVFLGIQYLLNWRKDPDSGVADTNQMVAAIEILADGQQAVIFDADGKKIPSPGYEAGKTDRDIVWRPDGNRLFFSSDRKQNAYHLYRWNPASGAVDQRSTGSLSKFGPSFLTVTDPKNSAAVNLAGQKALITQGGFVLEYDIRESSSQQLLPPPGGVTVGTEEGSGGTGQFDQIYNKFGNAFRTARWIKGGAYIAAIMKGDEHEVLVVQKVSADPSGTPEEQAAQMVPRPLMGGDRIDIDVDRVTGNLIFTVLNFQFPVRDNIPERNIKNGKIVKDFLHGVFVYDPDKQAADALFPVAVSNTDKNAFGPAAASPDGGFVAFTTGQFDGTNFEPAGIFVAPLQPGGIQAGKPVIGGKIYEISWHPNSNTLAYINRDGSERAIYKINKDGSGEAKISDGGNYMTPVFSPQSK